jgi:hypothetical protein
VKPADTLDAATVRRIRVAVVESPHADPRAWRRVVVVVGTDRIEVLTRAFVADSLRAGRVEAAHAVLSTPVRNGAVLVLATDARGEPRVEELELGDGKGAR